MDKIEKELLATQRLCLNLQIENANLKLHILAIQESAYQKNTQKADENFHAE